MLWRFADFELDDERGELRLAGGRAVPIEPKPLAVLAHLCRRHPQPVSARELHHVVWPGVSVTPTSVTRAVHALRASLESHRGAVVRTERRRGYAMAVPVIRTGATGRLSDAFVGRQDVLSELGAHLADALDGNARFAAVVGEPGIGKTRTLRAFTASLPARVLWVMHHAEGIPGFLGWRRVLEALGAEPDSRLLYAGGEATGPPEPVVPEPTASLEPSRARIELFDGVARALRRAARAEPLVLVLEDLHAASGESLRLLQFVVREVAAERILLVASYRNPATRSNGLDDVLADLSSLSHVCEPLVLSRFTRAEVEALLEQSSVAAADGCIDRLLAWTGGNPLFLREAVRLLRSSTGERPLQSEDIDRIAVSDELSALVNARIAELPSAPRRLLVDASVVGTEVPLRLLRATTQIPRARVPEAVRAATSARLIEPTPDGFRFTHELVRDALYESLDADERARRHGAIGSALETQHAPALEPVLASLSHHFGAAIPHVSEEQARRYALRAGEQAREQLAFEEATRHFSRALELSRPDDDPEERCDLLLRLGEAAILCGADEDAMVWVREAARLARDLDDPTRLARAALAAAGRTLPLLPNPETLDLLASALKVLPDQDSALRVRLLSQRARHLHFAGRGSEAAEPLREAIERADRLGDRYLRNEAMLQELHAVQMESPMLPPAERLRLADQVLADAALLGDRNRGLMARIHRQALLVQLGERGALEAEVEQIRRESDALGIRGHRHLAAVAAGMIALLSGDYAAARRAIEESEQQADPFSPTERIFDPLTQRMLLPVGREERLAVLRAIEQMVAAFPTVTPWRYARIWPLDALERRGEMGRILDEVVAGGLDAALPHNTIDYPVLAMLALASHRLGRPELAGDIRERLKPHSGHLIVSGFGNACWGPTDLYLGTLEALRGEAEAAEQHLHDALALAERVGSPPWMVWCHLVLAELLARGRPREAARHAARARATAERIGLSREAEQASRLVDSIGGPT